MEKSIKGRIIQIVGPVIDVKFELTDAELPNILNALEVVRTDGTRLVVECQQHIGENTIRCISMDSTDGLTRGLAVIDTGFPILMPGGDSVKGRLLNVIGKAIDGLPEVSRDTLSPIHKAAPAFDTLSTEAEIL
nr:F0F1 ATP synthase subunit beta [Breznakibacter sp.]